MPKANIFEEYADLFEAEDIDPKEYDYEGEMAKDQLLTMADAATELHDMLEDTENLPEWCQNKISKATDYIDTVRDYMLAKKTKAGGNDLDDVEKEMKEYKEMHPGKAVNKMVSSLAKKVRGMKNEISVGMRNKYYDAAKKSHDRAGNSAFARHLRKEPGIEKDLDTMRKRKAGIKIAKNQAIKNIRRELYPKKKKNENIDMYTKNTATKDKMAYKKDNQKNAPYNQTLEEWKHKLSESVVIEKLKVSDGMGAWVKDFQKSDAPQFKGKDDKERRDMAIAAYLSAKEGN